MLFLIYEPPPFHGAAISGLQLMTYYSNKENVFINIGLSRTSSNIGKLRLSKFFVLLQIIKDLLRELISRRHTKIYLSHTIRNSGFFRDMLILVIIKIVAPKIRLVYHIHNCSNRIDNNNKVLNYFLYSSSQVVYLSKLFYSSSFPLSTRLYTLPNYSEFSEKRNEMLSFYSLVCVANFDRFKGIYSLLSALKLLIEVSSSYNLSLVGAEGDISLEELECSLDSLGIKSNVSIYHKISHMEVQEVLSRSSIMILASEDEAMPMSLIEGCSSGLALISTNIGATSEIVLSDFNGYLIDGSVESIVEKVIRYKDNPELLATHSFNSICLAKERFNKEEYYKELNKILYE